MRLRLRELRTVLRVALHEGKVEDLLKRYEGHERIAEISEVIRMLSSSSLPIMTWGAHQVARGERPDEVSQMVREFKRFTQKLKDAGKSTDLTSYQTLGDLRGAIEELGTSRKDRSQAMRGEVAVIHEDENILVIHPESKQASCEFGRGTKWCVSATTSKNWFRKYNQDRTFLYFFILKGSLAASVASDISENMRKFSFAYESPINEGLEPILKIYDSADNLITSSMVRAALGNELYRTITKKVRDHFKNSKGLTGFQRRLLGLTPDMVEKTVRDMTASGETEKIGQWAWDTYVDIPEATSLTPAGRAILRQAKKSLKQAMTGRILNEDEANPEIRYMQSGVLHRLDGPALISADLTSEDGDDEGQTAGAVWYNKGERQPGGEIWVEVRTDHNDVPGVGSTMPFFKFCKKLLNAGYENDARDFYKLLQDHDWINSDIDFDEGMSYAESN
jgi:hypothetical protein